MGHKHYPQIRGNTVREQSNRRGSVLSKLSIGLHSPPVAPSVSVQKTPPPAMIGHSTLLAMNVPCWRHCLAHSLCSVYVNNSMILFLICSTTIKPLSQWPYSSWTMLERPPPSLCSQSSAVFLSDVCLVMHAGVAPNGTSNTVLPAACSSMMCCRHIVNSILM